MFEKVGGASHCREANSNGEAVSVDKKRRVVWENHSRFVCRQEKW
jgi:hypothetical protein